MSTIKKIILIIRNFRIVIAVIITLLPMCTADAQQINRSDQTFRFVYIDHTPNLPQREVIERLETLYDKASEVDNTLIIYMPSGDEPYTVKLNVAQDNTVDKPDEVLNKLIDALDSKPSSDNLYVDRTQILHLLNYMFDETGKIAYREVHIEFYLTSEFWVQGHNESILSAIFFALDAKNLLLKNEDFEFKVILWDTNTKSLNKDSLPFGKLNPDGINEIIKVGLPMF